MTQRPSKEYLEMRRIIEESRFRVTDINDACLIIPGFDSLNLNRFSNPYDDFHKAIAAGDRYLNSLILCRKVVDLSKFYDFSSLSRLFFRR